jgi:hypothetical protein
MLAHNLEVVPIHPSIYLQNSELFTGIQIKFNDEVSHFKFWLFVMVKYAPDLHVT